MDANIKAFLIRSIDELLSAPPTDRDEMIKSLESSAVHYHGNAVWSRYYVAAVILIRWFRIYKLKAGKNVY